MFFDYNRFLTYIFSYTRVIFLLFLCSLFFIISCKDQRGKNLEVSKKKIENKVVDSIKAKNKSKIVEKKTENINQKKSITSSKDKNNYFDSEIKSSKSESNISNISNKEENSEDLNKLKNDTSIKKVSEDVLFSDHYRQEYGINIYTIPSIEEMFDILEVVGDVQYDELRLNRDSEKETPRLRKEIALSLGSVIADGFLCIHAEKYNDLEGIARDLMEYTRLLGSGKRVKKHVRELQRLITLGDRSKIKDELKKTQKDVEKEMILLHDVVLAHFVSLGGWLRAFEITCDAVLLSYSDEKSKVLFKPELPEYFLDELKNIYESSEILKNDGYIKKYNKLIIEIESLVNMLNSAEEGKYTRDQVSNLQKKSKKINRKFLP